jgi:hypothetical protein
MNEETKEVEKKEEEKEEKQSPLNFKHWLTRVILLGIFFIALVVIFDYVFPIKILGETLIAISTMLSIGFLHEYMHYYKAKKLGYEVSWYRTRFMMGFSIEHSSIRGQRTPEKQKIIDDIKSIGRLPYYVLVPLSIVILLIGVYTWIWGFVVAGFLSLMFHGFSFTKEGRSA